MKKNRSQARDIMLSTLSILGLIVVWFLVSNSKPDFFRRLWRPLNVL